MLKSFLFPIALSGALVAADPAFNGRWDLAVPNQKVPRAMWLQIIGAETDQPVGRFVGAPTGQMDDVAVTFRGGELRFTLERKSPRTGEVYRARGSARLKNGQLEGVFSDRRRREVRWVGRRAPEIPDRDDGTWREGKPVVLFDGRELSGWLPIDPSKPLGWAVKDGVMTNQGGASNLYSTEKFWNFLLHVEFRVQKQSNSGIGLRGRYEVQIIDDYGRPVTGHSTAGVYGRIQPTVNATRPAGEWQTYDIRLVGRQVTVTLNGVKVIDKKEIEGLTAIAIDPNEGEPGPLVIQGDHGLSEFRSIVVTPLTR